MITKTKAAEADGNAIKIQAEAERSAAQLRGQGVALFREEVAHGMAAAAREMEQAKLDASFILFSMWTDAIKHFAENGKGNTIFLDASNNAMQRTMQELMAVTQGSSILKENNTPINPIGGYRDHFKPSDDNSSQPDARFNPFDEDRYDPNTGMLY